MILFFPQYQAGPTPSFIPVGTPSLRALWCDKPDFYEVPLAQNANDENGDGKIRHRKALRIQMLNAIEILEKANPDFVLTTGGDCGASFASIAHINKKYEGKIGVLWIDAHADIHLPSTSPSKNYHGMVLRNLMGSDEFDVQPATPLSHGQIAYLGLRATETYEDETIARLAVPRFNAKDIVKDNAPLDSVITHFQRQGITHLHLHVDCDVLDSGVFPHVHVSEPDGLTLERLLEILQYLRGKMPMAGCCLTEYAPGEPGAGLDIVKRIYQEGLGLQI